jgi:hypothetical protein
MAISILLSTFFVAMTFGWLMPSIIITFFWIGIIFGIVGILFGIGEKTIKTLIAEIFVLFIGFALQILSQLFIKNL